MSPARSKINLEAIRESLNVICPKCQAQFEPAQFLRVTSEGIKCPHCDSIVKLEAKRVPDVNPCIGGKNE